MATGKIRKRADVDRDRPRCLLAAKFVDREERELRWLESVEPRAPLVHASQPEEIGRIGPQAAQERMDECILGNGGKHGTLVPLPPESRRPLSARAG